MTPIISSRPHGDRPPSGSPTQRPAVVEHVGDPPPASDGRASTLVSQARMFAVIGMASTVAWALLYVLLRGALSPLSANAVALVVTAIGNTAANRRLTFGVRGRASIVRHHAAGLVAFALALGLTSGAAVGLGAVAPHAGRLVELGVLAVASLLATAGRFALLRVWVGRAIDAGPTPLASRTQLERIPS